MYTDPRSSNLAKTIFEKKTYSDIDICRCHVLFQYNVHHSYKYQVYTSCSYCSHYLEHLERRWDQQLRTNKSVLGTRKNLVKMKVSYVTVSDKQQKPTSKQETKNILPVQPGLHRHLWAVPTLWHVPLFLQMALWQGNSFSQWVPLKSK